MSLCSSNFLSHSFFFFLPSFFNPFIQYSLMFIPYILNRKMLLNTSAWECDAEERRRTRRRIWRHHPLDTSHTIHGLIGRVSRGENGARTARRKMRQRGIRTRSISSTRSWTKTRRKNKNKKEMKVAVHSALAKKHRPQQSWTVLDFILQPPILYSLVSRKKGKGGL